MIKELDTVRLCRAQAGLEEGALGCVVLVHEPGIYEVEFVELDGTTRALLTLPEEDLAVAETAEMVQAA